MTTPAWMYHDAHWFSEVVPFNFHGLAHPPDGVYDEGFAADAFDELLASHGGIHTDQLIGAATALTHNDICSCSTPAARGWNKVQVQHGPVLCAGLVPETMQRPLSVFSVRAEPCPENWYPYFGHGTAGPANEQQQPAASS